VPTLVGLTEDEARQRVRALGWEVTEQTERRDGTQAGEVIDTQPAEGRLLTEGRELTLVVSDGDRTRAVPTDLRGKPRAEAIKTLAFSEMDARVREVHDEEIPKDHVVNVEQGTPDRVERGDTVRLVVSKGPKPRVVPSGLAGLPVEQAIEQLERIQLQARPNEVFSDSTPEGIVISADTPGGTQVERGTTISLDVSKGPVPVPVPDVRQVQTLQEAVALLEEMGFQPGNVRGPADGHPARTIPKRGTLLAKGSSVDINMR
jgi:serine/threonine-protein kinase